jgi:hypothetical protein
VPRHCNAVARRPCAAIPMREMRKFYEIVEAGWYGHGEMPYSISGTWVRQARPFPHHDVTSQSSIVPFLDDVRSDDGYCSLPVQNRCNS